ncbi:SDR family NAD(P)-dependent oxidoreductase, partial [Rhizobium favelukesii]
MKKLSGKVAIIAGAGRGIGRATAELFAGEGAKVAVWSVTPANVTAVVDHIQSLGGSALGIECDLSDGDQITNAVAQVVEAFGGIDILVNVAFDPTVVHSSIIDLSVDQLQRNFDMGPIAYLRTMQACYPHLKEQTSRCTLLGWLSVNQPGLAATIATADAFCESDVAWRLI